MRILRWSVVAVVVAAGAVGGYLPYGWARTAHSDGIGVNLTRSAVGLLACSFVCSAFLLVFALWEAKRREPLSWFPWTLTGTVLAGMLGGCVLAEGVVLGDEAAFRAEVAESPSEPHQRARPWPFKNSSIYFAPQRGYWSTD